MLSGYWFSKNPDRAWAEKLYLIFIPVFFIYNAVMQQMGWVDAGNFWHITQDLLMWLPYCVILPLILRRNIRAYAGPTKPPRSPITKRSRPVSI
jgi:cycloeucalenol cycloisomerase